MQPEVACRKLLAGGAPASNRDSGAPASRPRPACPSGPITTKLVKTGCALLPRSPVEGPTSCQAESMIMLSGKEEKDAMKLWIEWFRCVQELRTARSRKRTFVWMCLVLVGFSIRTELLGVTSFVRSCFLRPEKYRRLLHLFHTSALNLDKFTELWIKLALKLFRPLIFQNHLLLVADELNLAKEGGEMPAVKDRHQASQDNSKPSFTMGHSFQAVGMLAESLLGGLFCVPLASRVHEGLVVVQPGPADPARRGRRKPGIIRAGQAGEKGARAGGVRRMGGKGKARARVTVRAAWGDGLNCSVTPALSRSHQMPWQSRGNHHRICHQQQCIQMTGRSF